MIARQGSDLLSALLGLTVEAFETRYGDLVTGVLRPPQFQGFDRVVREYFGFALPASPELLVL